MDYGLDKKSTSLKTFNTIFIIVWLLIACFPFIWTFWGSFKVRADFFSRSDWWYAISAFNTLIETGGKFTTDAYTQAWTEGEFWKARFPKFSFSPSLGICICCKFSTGFN